MGRTTPTNVGEVDEVGKNQLLGGAHAYLFPIDWPEPFGLTMAEAMGTGTPVVAFNAGSVPEVVEDGVTGFVCATVDEMVGAVGRVGSLDRAACRARVEALFSASVMTDGYERAYRSLLASRLPDPRAFPRVFTSPAQTRDMVTSEELAYVTD